MTLTFVFQSQADRRREKVEDSVRTWEARRSSYLDLVASLVEFRHERYQREKGRLAAADGSRPDGDAVRTARAATRVKSYQARRVGPRSSVVPTSWEVAYEQIRSFYDATGIADLEARTTVARTAIDNLVKVARDELDLQTRESFIDTVDDPRDSQER